jgi:Protein of unknown function (DUF3810)
MLKRNKKWIIVVGMAVAIKIFSFFPGAVEGYYSTAIYPLISRLLRILFGWIPFSIGDVFYIIVCVWLLSKIISFLKKLFGKRVSKPYLLYVLQQIVWYALLVYISFNLLWGLNYNRRGIVYQLQLKVTTYSTEDLRTVLQLVVDRLNALDSLSHATRQEFQSKRMLFAGSLRAYQNLHLRNPVFDYRTPSVKPSIFSYLGNYLGFSGYYNPFSGEAQVNTTVPLFITPFTTCHEMGHQLGYAKEDEANFAGYLAAKSSDDPAFKYSVYFDLYTYAAGELYMRDSTLFKPIRDQLRPGIRNDFKELRLFFAKYENPFEPYVRRLYGKYLKANEQPRGMMSYNEVTGRLIAYYKKYGKEAL